MTLKGALSPVSLCSTLLQRVQTLIHNNREKEKYWVGGGRVGAEGVWWLYICNKVKEKKSVHIKKREKISQKKTRKILMKIRQK